MTIYSVLFLDNSLFHFTNFQDILASAKISWSATPCIPAIESNPGHNGWVLTVDNEIVAQVRAIDALDCPTHF